MRTALVVGCVLLCRAIALAAGGDAADGKYPLDERTRVLAEDVASPAYQKLVDDMLLTDLAAEWQRVETADSPAHFLANHGGKDRVLADPDLKQAHERRVDIHDKFLAIMRRGFQRYKRPAPFDQGATAEEAETKAGRAAAAGGKLEIVLPAPGADEQWPRFRGPTGQGNSTAQNLPLHWSATENVVWKSKLPGSGNSSPIIWQDRLFVTSAGEQGTQRSVHCLRLSDGSLLWSRTLPAHEVEPNVREKNGFASATPVTDGQRVIAFLGSGGLVAYDFAGRQLWHHPLPVFNTTWGTGASPLLYHDLVILVQDQNKAESLFIALDKNTGAPRWQQKRDKAMGWSTPIIVRAGDHDELIYAGGETVRGYDPHTGQELWVLRGATREVVPTIIVGRDLLYAASGRQGPTLGLRPGGHGEVTDTHLAWRTPRGGPHVPSPVLYEGRLYTVNDTGIATCLNAADGKLLWQARIRDKFSASPLESQGRLYCPSESGVTYVLEAGPKFKILAQNDLGQPILASPAALNGRLYLRTADEVFCLAKGAPGK
ncbi:MAG TPA: PQQ-binding-like beta-propeller repeat protein [Pirellulales bacterium]